MAVRAGFGPRADVWRHCSDFYDAILIYLALQLPFFARNACIFNGDVNLQRFILESGVPCVANKG